MNFSGTVFKKNGRLARALSMASVVVLLTACASTGPASDLDTAALGENMMSAGFDYPDGASPIGSRVNSSGEVVSQWWQQLDDVTLNELVNSAMQHNHDVRIALGNLALARTLRDGEALNYRPTTSASVEANRQRAAEASGIPTAENPFDSYRAGFDAGWELDLFGRLRHTVEAANAELAATQAELDGVYVALAAEVAARYIQLRGLQQRRNVAQRHADNLAQSHDLTTELMNAGMGDALDVQRALTQYELVRARLPALDAQIDQTIRRLSVLTGQNPGALMQQVAGAEPLPSIPPSISTGDPKELLQRRPDLRRAEHQLNADIARYQVSVSDLYPRISISGSIGFLATRFADLGSGGTYSYLFGPRLSWDAFDMGRLQNRIDAQDIRVQNGLAEFEKTLLTALEEVENAMSSLSREGERQNRLRAAADASARASELAGERFEAGSDSFLDVLDAQRTQLEAEDLLTQSETDMALSVVSVYKALGGGWQR